MSDYLKKSEPESTPSPLSPEMQRASTRLFNLGDLRAYIKGMPDSVICGIMVGDLNVPIAKITQTAPMAGRWPPSTVAVIPDEEWLQRAFERREAIRFNKIMERSR